jgi:alanyl-tRNA synthetase
MGETGPCGPCTEIHIDRTPDKSGGPLVNKGDARVMEIWNLVFIQFNRNPDRSLTPLPAKHVDTGMGFERVTAVIQGKDSNYDTDLFAPIFDAIQKVTGAPKYTGKLDDLKDTAYRVIADHVRMLMFAITDGAVPSNTKRGSVLRGVLRRAERFGWQRLGTTTPFLCDVASAVIETMGRAFPELRRKPDDVRRIIRDEEEGFLRTLDRGIKLFQDAAAHVRAAGGDTLSDKVAFDLHTEQGVYIEITEQMAAEENLNVDRIGFDRLFDEFKQKSRETAKKHVVTVIQGDLPKTDDAAKYVADASPGTVIGWIAGSSITRQGQLAEGESVALLLDRSNYYSEAGGQVGDIGTINTLTGQFEVEDTQRLGDAILHFGLVTQGNISVGQPATLRVNGIRLDTMRNHTSTHLMNLALRDILGDHVEQKGSLVDPGKTRFDFTHQHALTHDEIARIERHVNERIQADLPVVAVTMPLADAKKLPGVRAVFGEKYPDPVRVVMIGAERPEQVTRELSTEFCGGTHLQRSSQAGLFKIVSQEAVAKGVRRVTAITGKRAIETMQHMSAVLDDLSTNLNCRAEELPARIAALLDELKKLQQQLKKGAATDLAGVADKLLTAATELGGAKLVVGEVPAAPVDAIRSQVDRLRQKAGSSVIALGWADDGKVGLLVAVTDDLVKKGLHAGKLVGEAAKAAGGKGGGNPTLAQAGGKDPAKLGEALALAARLASEQLSK